MSSETVEYFKQLVNVNNQLSLYDIIDETIIYDGKIIDEWTCKDKETATRLLSHLRRLEKEKINYSTLATVLRFNDLTDEEYKECKKYIHESIK